MPSLTYGAPQKVGMDPERLALIDKRAKEWLHPKRMRSVCLLVARRGKIVFHEAYGPLTGAEASPLLEKDSVFSIASVTKMITATAAMILVEDGRLGLNRPVKEYVPELSGKGVDDIEVQHLLTHTSGFRFDEEVEKITSRWQSVRHLQGRPDEGWHKFHDRMFACLWDMDSHWQPGTMMEYCDFNYSLLGEVVRRVSGEPLDRFVETRIFEPLGMIDATMTRDPAKDHRQFARGSSGPMSVDDDDFMARVEAPSVQLAPFGGVSANATAMDMAKFAQMFLDHGIGNGNRILSPASVREMTRNQIPGIGTDFFGGHSEASWGLGFIIQDTARWAWNNATLTPVGSFGHGGASSHNLWISPEHELSALYLSVCKDFDTTDKVGRWNGDLFLNMVMAAVLD